MPGHCKDVAVKEVDFPLTIENIARAIRGKQAYTRCDHYVLRNGDDLAVVRVAKKNGVELFRDIVGHEVLALPKDIAFIHDSSLDVLNAPLMARTAARYPGKVVVVQGLFEHISFILPGETLELEVLDVVPPRPSKLSVLVERALTSGLVELPVVPHYIEIDLNELSAQAKTDAIIFPCRASGLRSDKRTYFLDQLPVIEGDATLVGCELSERIYRSRYRKGIERIEMCPRALASLDGRKRLVKCCRVREGFVIEGNTAIVPWGVTVKEVASAITALFSS